jgi:hypothetical protein
MATAQGRFQMDTIDADIWQNQRLLAGPRTSLVRWQVIEVSYIPYEHYFFIGHCPSLEKSIVSDFIISFNPSLGLGLGQFGEIYQLEGESGFDRKANYMLRKMLRAMPGSERQNITKECKKTMVMAAVLTQKMRELPTLLRSSFGHMYQSGMTEIEEFEKHVGGANQSLRYRCEL